MTKIRIATEDFLSLALAEHATPMNEVIMHQTDISTSPSSRQFSRSGVDPLSYDEALQILPEGKLPATAEEWNACVAQFCQELASRQRLT